MMDELDPAPAEFSIPDEAFAGAVEYDPNVHHKPTTAHYSSAWILGPGTVTLLTEAVRDLLKVSALRGEPATEIAFVRLLALRSVKTLLVWPSNDTDLKAVEVTLDEGTARFVATQVLRSAKIPVESGKRIRYQVHVLKTSKVGPALAIDMRNELDVKVLPKRKSSGKGKSRKVEQPAPEVESNDEA
jgi:hypothetical protein